MANKKSSGWSSNLRQSFNLVPEDDTPQPQTGDAPEDSTLVQQPTEIDLQAPVGEPATQTTDFAPLTSSPAARSPGRPKSIVERFPKTIYLTTSAERALRRAVEQIQEWRGRQRGVPKAQESEATSVALEYLYTRMYDGEEAAEAFFREYQSSERSRHLKV